MKYTVTFELSPSHAFGLPEPGTTVVPGGQGSVNGPTLDTVTGKLVGHGTMSRFREDAERLQALLSLTSSTIRLNDNFAFVDAQGSSSDEALALARSQLDLLLKCLAIERKSVFFARIVAMSTEEGENVPLPTMLGLGNFAFYDTNALRQNFEAAAELAIKDDDALRRALGYFEHALFYWSQAASKLDLGSETRSTAASIALLHLWKCCTTLLGDPSRRRDGYQKRFLELGLDYSYKARLDHLKKLRDDHDVAHSPDAANPIANVEAEITAAIELAREAVQAYARAKEQGAG